MAGLLRNWDKSPGALLAVHADWSINPGKRWMCVARRHGGCWRLGEPVRVGPVETLIARLLEMAGPAPVALGVDFPLGLPRAYAKATGIADFPAWLRALAPESPFFNPSATLAEAGPERPFYPRRSVAGSGQMARLATALGLDDATALRREVDFHTSRRPAGAPLFWTMGANQCGKAAIAGWRDCLLPAFAAGWPLRLWPFDGAFRDLLASRTVTVAETYPAEAQAQLGLRLKGSKRRQADRAALAPALLDHLSAAGIIPARNLLGSIRTGFGPSPDHEDPFDCLLGVLGLIRVIEGAPDGTGPGEPGDQPVIRAVEGWVLGQIDPPLPPASA